MKKNTSILMPFLLVSLIVSVYLKYCLGIGVLYIQLFYLYIIIVAFEFNCYIIPLAIFLGILHITLEYFASGNVLNSFIRAGIIIIVSTYLYLHTNMFHKSEEKLKENQNKYKMLFENMTQGFALHEIITDGDGKPIDYRYIEVNNAFENLTGLKAKDIINKTTSEILANIERNYVDMARNVALTGEPCNTEKYYVRLGKHFNVWIFRPQINQLAIILSDITDRKNMENELKLSEQTLKSYFENAPEAIFVVNREGSYIGGNMATTRITGYSQDELFDMNVRDLVPKEFLKQAKYAFGKLVKTGEMLIEIPYVRKDNEVRIWSINAVKIKENEYIGFSKDITEEKSLQTKLQYNYYHDDLTGCYNRRYINEQLLDTEFNNKVPLSVIVGDINGLKITNEAFGRNAGDEVINKISAIIKKFCSDTDIIAKWDGDEFIILLPNSNEKRAEQIICEINFECQKDDTAATKLSISFGFATKINADDSFENVINIAEDMMMINKTYESPSFRGQTINMILKTLHEKNKREEQHSRRVSEICVSIGKAMNFSDSEISKLRIIGLVHDIGKIGIDENILNKQDILTQKEWVDMKKHCEIGYRLLSSTNETSELAEYALNHHERLDGNGYPNGISGDSISVITRILSIADAYDAMTAKRTYREMLTQEQAIQELYDNIGTHFDPYIVDIFVNQALPYNNNFVEIKQ